MKSRHAHPVRSGASAFALVVTLIMVTLAAVIVIALLSSATLDRTTSSNFGKRFRAEMAAESGLAAALNAISGASGPNDFRFVTAVGDGANGPIDSSPALIPLDYTPGTGVVSLSPDRRPLVSITPTGGALPSPTPATLTLSSTITPHITRHAGVVPLTTKDSSGNDQETGRYAFYVDEAGSRQNLVVQGGSNRVYAKDPSELPLLSATVNPSPFSLQQVTDLKLFQSLLLTVPTANAVLSANATTPAIDAYSYATASAITNLTPEGKPRINLSKLKAYVDGLPVDQTNQPLPNLRSVTVDRLLNPAEPGDDWGGGNLSILTKLPLYSGIKAKQIVANLLDYIDSDLIPTTDNVDNPTYFGVEGRASSDGTVVGHPYINFVGTGLVFNRSNASGSQGGLNSTRVLVTLGIVNPWTKPTKDWDTFYVKPEFEIKVTGDASGGTLGNHAQDYFHSDFSTSYNGNQLTAFPSRTIAPNVGYSFPSPASSITNYANVFDILNTGGGRQPPGMVFSNLGFQITKLRLKFTDTDGRSGYVQVLDGLNTVPQPADPSTVDLDHSGSPSSLTYKFASGAPNKTDFHLNNDPRLNFLSSSWILSKSTEASNTANPPNPSTAVDVFHTANIANYDFAPQPPSVRNHLWYTNANNSKNFYAKSPPVANIMPAPTPSPAPALLESAGEIGFIHTGIPWETLRLYVTGGEQNGKERDRELLAYVHSGTFDPADYTSVSVHPSTPPLGTTPTPIPLMAGPINLNTNKRPTLQSLFLGASATLDSDATARANGAADPDAASLADAVAINARSNPLAIPGDFLSLAAAKAVTDAQTKDFDREILARRLTNVVGTQSTRFTVYSLGEARDKAGANIVTTSTVNLRAEVEMQLDSNGKPTPKVLSTAYYTTQ